MNKLLLTIALFSGLNLHAATIKSIKGKKASLKLSADELNTVESDTSYEMISNGASVGRIKVTHIYPGKGVSGVLEARKSAINSASNIQLKEAKVDAAEQDDDDDDDDQGSVGKPSYGRPEVESSKIGWDFNLLMGTHTLASAEEKDQEDTSSKKGVYASNVSLRAVYKLSSIPLGIGGHVKNNMIKQEVQNGEDEDKAELEWDFTAVGFSLMAVHDFGHFRPYALYEYSSGTSTINLTFTNLFGARTKKELGKTKYDQQALIVGGAWVFGGFSMGLEYQAVGIMQVKPFDEDSDIGKINATGFSLNLGYSI